jgi:hypothetical protein
MIAEYPSLVVKHASIRATHSAAYNAEAKLLGAVPPFPHTSSWRDPLAQDVRIIRYWKHSNKNSVSLIRIYSFELQNQMFYYGLILRLAL